MQVAAATMLKIVGRESQSSVQPDQPEDVA
jgi:hypothetical protein